MTENRQHPRRAIQIPIAFQVGDGDRVDAVCSDISLGGMFVETETPAAYGASIVVSVELPGLKGPASIQATVRWVKRGSGMGLQFGRMGARETHAIVQLMQHG